VWPSIAKGCNSCERIIFEKKLIIGISNYKRGSNARMYGGMNMMHA
jgi:hypothetical protein